jgi:hypothetical protein
MERPRPVDLDIRVELGCTHGNAPLAVEGPDNLESQAAFSMTWIKPMPDGLRARKPAVGRRMQAATRCSKEGSTMNTPRNPGKRPASATRRANRGRP